MKRKKIGSLEIPTDQRQIMSNEKWLGACHNNLNGNVNGFSNEVTCNKVKISAFLCEIFEGLYPWNKAWNQRRALRVQNSPKRTLHVPMLLFSQPRAFSPIQINNDVIIVGICNECNFCVSYELWRHHVMPKKTGGHSGKK